MIGEEKIIFDWVKAVFLQSPFAHERDLQQYVSNVLYWNLRCDHEPWINFHLLDAKFSLAPISDLSQLRNISKAGIVRQVLMSAQDPYLSRVMRRVHNKLYLHADNTNQRVDGLIAENYHSIQVILCKIGGNSHTGYR